MIRNRVDNMFVSNWVFVAAIQILVDVEITNGPRSTSASGMSF